MNKADLKRYLRQSVLKDIGAEGQKKIEAASVLVIGAGGLGSPSLYYLAAAGVGRIGVADSDKVEISNLNRQILHTTGDIGREKTLSAAEKLRALNPGVKIEEHNTLVTSDNAADIISGYDFIIDAVDSFEAKFLINDAAVLANKPFVHSGVQGFTGQMLSVIPGLSPCLRCIMPIPPDEEEGACLSFGILGAVAGVFGSLQASEALKYIIHSGDLLTGRLLSVDIKRMRFKTLSFEKDPSCSICSDERITDNIGGGKWSPSLEAYR